SNGNDQETFDRGVSLNHFQKLTSDSKRGLVRRGLIRNLRYHLVIPIDLPDWEARKRKGYKLDNETRKDNDAAFQSGIIDLFETLAPWCQSSRISVELILLGCKVGKEPYSDHFDIAGDYRFDFTDGQTKAVPVYRARFIGDDASLLPNVACIECLSFPKEPYHRIWAGSAMQIAQHCSTITELRLDLDEYIRPDHLEYIQARRRAVYDGLEAMAHSLRVFDLTIQDERPWKEAMPGLNVLISDIDHLSQKLGCLSLTLRQLRLENVSLAPDFLFPLDETGCPLPSSAFLHWPYLETVDLGEIPPRLPSGQWLVHPTTEEQEELDAMEDWEEIICGYEEGLVCRDILDSHHFNRVLISMGYAAQTMPRLVSMLYDLNHSYRFRFNFRPRGQNSDAEWYLESRYRPTKQVADAWGCPLVELDAELELWDHKTLVATIPQWPPK
ncbi:hypothetical protein N7486_001905, partial [Penicillium sp. IBT 16267x]